MAGGYKIGMTTWHVWGTYGLVEPKRLGKAQCIAKEDHAARRTAEAQGFQWDEKCRNGMTPWASTFEASDDDGVEQEFANHPIVLGWKRV